MNYRYILDTSSKKYRCKKCNKNTLVRFIDTETGEEMPTDFGRCDRQSKCGYFESPKGSFTKDIEYKYEAPKPVSYHDYNLVLQTGKNYNQNNFVQFLKSLFSEEEVKNIIQKYLIGTSKRWNGSTIFWQIDNKQNVRHGKIMLYDSNNGKRKKDDKGKAFISSVRSELKLKDSFNLKQCLFGLHLINENESKTLALIESEKTAILMSAFKPEYVWLATGSSSGLKYEYLNPIRDYNIIAFPDKSEYYNWQNKADNLNKLGFNIKVNNWLETLDYPKGTDLADVLITEKLYKIKPVPQELICESNPIAIIRTPTENNVLKMAKINPFIINLIKTFDLIDNNGMTINA